MLTAAAAIALAFAAPALACEPADVVDASGDAYVVTAEGANCAEVVEFIRGYAKTGIITDRNFADAMTARFGEGSTVLVDEQSMPEERACQHLGS